MPMVNFQSLHFLTSLLSFVSAFWGEDLLEVMAILDVLLLKLYKLYK